MLCSINFVNGTADFWITIDFDAGWTPPRAFTLGWNYLIIETLIDTKCIPDGGNKLILNACISYNVHKCKVNAVFHTRLEMENDTNNRFLVLQSKFFRCIWPVWKCFIKYMVNRKKAVYLHLAYNLCEHWHLASRPDYRRKNPIHPTKNIMTSIGDRKKIKLCWLLR